jgi:D-sedoheptulose 7-phosphate isomerase
MTFPDVRFSDVNKFYDEYTRRLAAAHASVDKERLAEATHLLGDIYRMGGTLFTCGNGGSASIADSFVGDHAKLVQTDTPLVPHITSLCANIPLFTAIANDISYDDVFIYQLRTQARLGDALLVISSSGDSENVVRAAKWARESRLEVIAFTGFNGGRLAELATIHLHVDADNYGLVEDVHQSLMHVMAQFIRQANMSDKLIAVRRF